ncbi:MAG: amino acid adenylation domain-containing protein, partial [Deltaproteobacteria bacterium]|nr:amino acid adenylation domain-containing protein [Deltaproteobacteria bacterium]
SLLRELNKTETELPELCLHQLFEEQVDRRGDEVAVVCDQESLDYRSLDRRANHIAHLLAHHGVTRGDRVGIYLERSPELVAALLGVLKLGAAYLPMDPEFPRARLAEMLSDSGAKAVVCARDTDTLWMSEEYDAILIDPDSTAISTDERLDSTGSPDDLAYLIYTSGSTGRPKGVEICHRSLVNIMTDMARELELSGADRLLAVTTISFDIAALELFLPLVSGATVHLASAEEAADGHRLALLMERARPTLMQATPATWRMLLTAGWEGSEEMTILCGGEALPGDLAQELVGRGKELVNLYGPTETTIWSSIQHVREASGIEGLPEPIGRPIANTRIYILAPDAVEPVPVGVPGELCIAGVGVARGYHERPELTALRFVDDPFVGDGGGRMYRTGDLARYRTDGTIEYLGRTDDQVKIRGYRIEPSEVEASIMAHGAVASAVVACRGEGLEERRLVAWVVPQLEERPTQVTEEQLEQWQQVWEGVYADGPAAPDATFDISGWHDSIRGEPITDDEMREWAEMTAQRLRALDPSRVLEIGCGTGLIVARLAPHCQQYVATDFSAAALENVARLRREISGLDHVQVELKAANDLAGFEPEQFDLVILNSVVQYFPSAEYLLNVLTAASRVVRPGGAIFLGDLRDLRLLEAFHTSVQLQQVPDHVGVRDLVGRVANRMAEEEELLIDPAFVATLRGQLPRVTGTGVLLRRGTFDNELTRYRYDAILRVGGPADDIGHPHRPDDVVQEMDWGDLAGGLDELKTHLGTDGPEALTLRHAPNARLSLDSQALALLREGQGTVADVRRSLKAMASSGIDPESLWALGKELGYDVAVSWAKSGDPACCDAFFRRPNGQHSDPWRCLPESIDGASLATLDGGTNDPLRGKLVRRLVPDLRRHLEGELPSYMVPSAFVMLEALPLTPNQKVDRKALPAPELLGFTSERGYSAPATPTEARLAEIFAKVLGLPRVGTRDSFFELGGHSLLATQVVSRIREDLGLEIPVRRLFETPTVVELALHLDALAAAASHLEPAPSSDEDREEGVV